MAAAAPGAAFPMDINIAEKEVYQLVSTADLSELTSNKVRKHLSETFGVNFDPYKDKVNDLTRQAILKLNKKNEESDSDSDDDKNDDEDKKSDCKKESSSSSDSDSDHGVASTQRAKKKSKVKDASPEFSDLATTIKSTRRAAASRAMKDIKKSAGPLSGNKRKKEKDPNADNSGKFGRMTKLCYITPELQEIVGSKYMKRCDVVKKLWEYIKENNLTDPKNKQFVISDAKLETIMKRKRFKGFSMVKFLTKHVINPGDIDAETVAEANEEMERLKREWRERQMAKEAIVDDDDDDEPKSKIPKQEATKSDDDDDDEANDSDSSLISSRINFQLALYTKTCLSRFIDGHKNRMERESRSKPKKTAIQSFLGRLNRSKSRDVEKKVVENGNENRDPKGVPLSKSDGMIKHARRPSTCSQASNPRKTTSEHDLVTAVNTTSSSSSTTSPIRNQEQQQQTSAVSEMDLRFVTSRNDHMSFPFEETFGFGETSQRGFLSENDLSLGAVDFPEVTRTPSYLRVSRALNGYTKTPKRDLSANSPINRMGESLVERRLKMFSQPQDRTKQIADEFGTPVASSTSASSHSNGDMYVSFFLQDFPLVFAFVSFRSDLAIF
ncbi:unnamed protein product [Caenorhabditis bovis]|uniref:DM2 domain-containing protein n=1 Tax=Caenorhabditis bovis TaxID=2654633 RepID=A0A8S1EGC4_9PELO|nr:unnamed protein product [Caenorhabditis bovis]